MSTSDMSLHDRVRVRLRHEAGELIDTEACRVLVGGRWLVVAVPYGEMRERFDAAGREYRAGHDAIYLGETPMEEVVLLVDRGRAYDSYVCASFGAGWAVAEVDATDRDRLGLLPF